MQSFAYERAASLPDARAAAAQADTALLAGGTELLNWMKEGIAAPRRVLDINALPGLDRIEAGPAGLRLGALLRMSAAAEHPAVRRDYPALSSALLQSASGQLRDMASLGGNLLQRTRCPYFRAEVELPCNKRRPGSGCAALTGDDRGGALFGASRHCVATHPSDLAVALVALEAQVEVTGPAGDRGLPLDAFHRLPGTTPERETSLEAGEILTAIVVPASPRAQRSHYLKVRERASYEFALVSAAAAVELEGGRIRSARLALGGVAPRPWRLRQAEERLQGLALDEGAALRRALEPDFSAAEAGRHNAFKLELALRTAVRALQNAGETP